MYAKIFSLNWFVLQSNCVIQINKKKILNIIVKAYYIGGHIQSACASLSLFRMWLISITQTTAALSMWTFFFYINNSKLFIQFHITYVWGDCVVIQYNMPRDLYLARRVRLLCAATIYSFSDTHIHFLSVYFVY